jgi:peptidoglycan glycosyltransferase
MNRQIRRMGLVLTGLMFGLMVWLSYWQVFAADRLDNDPRNTRRIVHDFSQPRGAIVTSDGAVIARSEPSGDAFKLLRVYPEGQLFGHVAGYFSFTYGSDGVERVYNSELTGHTTQLRLTHLRDTLLGKTRAGDLTLTLSKRVQQTAADALGPHKGAVVALDPRDGSVLAMWSYPSYDPSPLSRHDQQSVRAAWQQLNTDTNKPLLARSYRERYFPGSTFKVVTSAVALSNGDTTESPTFPYLTELPLPNSGGQTLKNFANERCGGALPDILAVSCNTAFAQLGMDLGADKMSTGAEAFGFDTPPPIDLPSPAVSVFPPASAFLHDKPGLAKSAIGQQDVQASPLQMALVAAGVANGGSIMRPHVLREVRDSEGAVVERYSAREWRQAVAPDVAATLRDLMIGVVDHGTATRVAIPGTQVAAKTGTAQTDRNTQHAWMIAFAPADQPRVAVAVIVEDQRNSEDTTGGAVAAPIAKAVIQAALASP